MSSKDLNIIRQFESADLEDFKRPNHTDFMTSSELRDKKFNGVRHNSLNGDMEMWVEGDKKFSVTKQEMILNPKAWENKFREYFALN